MSANSHSYRKCITYWPRIRRRRLNRFYHPRDLLWLRTKSRWDKAFLESDSPYQLTIHPLPVTAKQMEDSHEN